MQVRARWDDAAGPWQQLVLRRAQDGACSSAEPLRYGDALSLTIAHLGKYVSASAVAGGRVCADRQRQGEYGAKEPLAHELFVLERAVVGARDGAVVSARDCAVVGARDGAVVHVGEAVRLRAAGVRAVSGAPLYLLSAEDRGNLRECNLADCNLADCNLADCTLAEDGGGGGWGGGGGGGGGGGDDGGPERVSLGVLSEGAPSEHVGVWTLHAGAAQLPPMRIGLEVPLVH
jgi:hypothetical protein